MSEIFLLYLLTRLNAIIVVAALIGAVSSMVLLMWMIGFSMECNERKIPKLKKFLLIPIISIAICVFVPTQREALFIVAGTQVIELARNPDVKRVAGKSAQLIEKYIDGLLEEKK